ncbi:MAG TPA: PAS domain S-box protein, partial [Spirochaetia bacterium]|nr:PAS domain S-box protein [Spirochaetia bacterium]
MPRAVVLIVEDESVVALNIAHIVRALGYGTVGPVATGDAALEKLAQEHVDLVLMDIRLKGAMDGIQVAEQIGRTYRIPVIYVTAYTDAETLQRAKLTTPYGYITKSFDERELHSTIEMALYKHRMEQRLLAEEELLETTLNSIADAVVTVDDMGTIRFLNRAAAELFAHDPAVRSRRNLQEVARLFDRDGRRVDLFASGEEVEGVQGKRATLLRDDGSIVPVEWTAVRTASRGERQDGWVLVFRDVSAWLRAAQAQARLVSLVESSDDAIMSVSLGGDVLSWNLGAEKMYGYSRGEMVGKPLSLLFADSTREESHALIHRIVSENEPLQLETVHRCDSGMLIDVQIKAQSIRDFDLSTSAVSLTVRDITARKSLDRRLREMRNREQARIGRDLHDSLGQQLAGLLFKTKVLERHLSRKGSGQEAIEASELGALLSDALRKTKDLARGLLPATLQAEGLSYALHRLCGDAESLYGMRVVCRINDAVSTFGQLVDTELYHIAEEAIGNAARHSSCTQIILLLSLDES